MTISPQFSAHTLPEVFRDLYLGESSGVLTLRRDQEERRVYFSRGLIQHAESSRAEERLGDVLVRRGLVSSGALAEAERGTSGTEELAQSLINRGLIAKEALQRTIHELVSEIVRGAFAWTDGAAEFHEADQVPELCEATVLSTFSQILDGIAAQASFESIGEALWASDGRLRLRRPAPVPVERLALNRTQGYLLARVDGTSTVPEILATVPPGEEDTAVRFLFGLLTMGVVEYEPPIGDGPFRVVNLLRDHADRAALEKVQEKMIRQAYGRMRAQNPNEVLGVTPHASRPAIERAYEEAKALFGRERLRPRVRERLRSELAVIESRLIEAYLQLTQPDRAERGSDAAPDAASRAPVDVTDLLVRPELDKTRSRVALDEAGRVAELYYVKARQAMRSGDYHNAIQYGKLALSYNGEDARFYFLLADCQARNPGARWQRLAEENYTRATQLDPWKVDYWISLGRFYKNCGLHLRARRQFEEALKLAPEHDVAREELKSLR